MRANPYGFMGPSQVEFSLVDRLYRIVTKRRGGDLNSGEIVGLVMAAGESTRFGSAKQLLPFGDTTLLGHVVLNVNASSLDRVIVVLGRSADDLKDRVDFGRAAVVDNRAYRSGCASSLLAGLDALGEGESAALMLILGDQPGVGTAVIDRAAMDWREHRPWAAVASYRGELGHPFLFARSAFEDLRALHGDKAVWKLIEAYPERVRQLELDSELPPDIDTPEDYERVLANWPGSR